MYVPMKTGDRVRIAYRDRTVDPVSDYERPLAPLWWYFGDPWGSPICEVYERGVTPVGTICYHCQEAIAERDRGFVRPFTDGVGVWPVPLHVDCAVCDVARWRPCKRHAL